ncbi:MAG: MBL fold metallo-hydrolase [Candidatus Micrarchaeota archaeon]
MEIVFLGTGGGRFNLVRQVRGTGGFRVNARELKMHVDPGPGALLRSLELRQSPLELDALFVSHSHVDHSNDANVLIEGMTEYTRKKRGVIIASPEVLEGGHAYISKYHQSLPKKCYSVEPGDTLELNGARIEITPARHDAESAVGFKLRAEGKILGYTGDTEYFDALGEIFAGCDLLIINNLRPRDNGIPGHLTSDGVIKILNVARNLSMGQMRICAKERKLRPNNSLITHLGIEFTQKLAREEAARITRESGIETRAARDGMRVKL